MQTVKRLHDLQTIDLKVDELEGILADVRARLEDDSAITSAAARLTAASEALDEVGVRRRAAERAIGESQERLESIEKRLYGGAITSLDEMTAAEEERAFVVQQLREQEDDLLELMVQTEDAEATQAEARESLSELETGRPAEQAHLRQSEQRTTGELDEWRRQRDDVAPDISPEMFALYESLRKSTNGSPRREDRARHVPGLPPDAVYDGAPARPLRAVPYQMQLLQAHPLPALIRRCAP